MAKNLVIVESPTKAKTIKKMLGSNYKVVASIGHIRDLPKSTMGIDIENDFEPKYINIRGKGPLIKELKKDAKDASKIFLATDPDREGEAISWHLSHILDLNPKDKVRVTFNEITKDKVKGAIKEPKSIDMNLVDAQQARRVLDRLAGYNISPFLWKKIKSGLSAGRVQSVVLKLICDREDEIREFIPELYFTIEASHLKSRKTFNSEYYGKIENGKAKKDKITSEKQAKEIIDSVDLNNFKVLEISKSDRTRVSQPPFTTSTMQQQASTRLSFSTKKTMMVAQKLYEGIYLPKVGEVGLITYMRTDSTRVSKEAEDNAFLFINSEYGSKYLKGHRSIKSKDNVQDAHECIRPTDVTRTPESIKDSLSRDEYKLYSLIWKRFVASFMSPAIYENQIIDIASNDNLFKAKGSTIVFDGFLKVYNYAIEKDTILPPLEKNETIKTTSCKEEKHYTQPPARYSEATLIKLLEDLGIGRPSTYAPTISTILSRYYVVIEDKKFVPTELGETVNNVMKKYFKDLVDENFTAKLETGLDKIAEGDMFWKEIVREFYKDIEDDLKVADKDLEKIDIRDQETDEVCEKCGRKMVIKMGRFGKFLACPGWPECKNTKPLLEKIGVKCPKCNKGDIVVKRSKKGRKFFGCSRYPDCDFVSWDEPVEEKCPKCGENLTKVRTRSGVVLRCPNKDCNFQK